MHALPDVFGDRIISSGIWPARSPYLNVCDLFFWGCLKVKVYNSNARTEELKEKFEGKLQIFLQNLFRRCEECLHVKGQHLQHLL
jgi:hypothetical protein